MHEVILNTIWSNIEKKVIIMSKKIAAVASKRFFHNIFICMKCNARRKAKPDMVKSRKIKCRKCGSKQLRPKAKERRGQTK